MTSETNSKTQMMGTITFGKPIPYQTFDRRFTDAQWAEKLRTFSYNLANDADLVFDPQKEYTI